MYAFSSLLKPEPVGRPGHPPPPRLCEDCRVVLTTRYKRLCPPCALTHFQAHRASSTAYYHTLVLASQDLPGPNTLACCGRWHALESLPFRCPQCQATYFHEEGSHGQTPL
jgi:hypothetical protein